LIFIAARQFRICWCGEPSLTREQVCRLQLLLALASEVILGSESSGFMTTFYYLRFETPPTWRARSPYLYPTETGWSSYTPRHWVPYSCTFTTRRDKVHIFEPPQSGQSVLEYSTHLGLKTRSFLMSDSCRLVDVRRSLWREDGSVICQCHSQRH
jgi:hypothetical protein